MRVVQQFNRCWRFHRLEAPQCDAEGYAAPSFDDSGWEEVILPHTPRLEPVVVNDLWQGVCWYRKRFATEDAWKDARVFIDFGAGMQVADVWVNRKHRCHHAGGYQGFVIDITGDLVAEGSNLIAVRLDNRDTCECPPGKNTYGTVADPLSGLDFHYFGGLYREVRLTVTDCVHISDPLHVHVEEGGGVFVRFEGISEASATMMVKTHVVNECWSEARCRLTSVLLDMYGNEVARMESDEVVLPALNDHTFEQSADISHPSLWHPNHPYLYLLRSQVYRDGELIDEVTTRVGIRHIVISYEDGLRLNGQPMRLFGSNRHQEHPYIGYALSANANWRDAYRAKAAGLNFIRLSHYPQHPAFLDACDELGIMVQAPVPGWQQFHNCEAFVSNAYRDVRQLIRRDRNHPSVILWEVNLNETASPSWFTRECQRIAHAEYPGDQCFTLGDGPGWQAAAVWDVLHAADPTQRKPTMIREYGDWAFGGNGSTTRQLRRDGEDALLQQAWNFLWSHNQNGARVGCIGDASWCLFDYNRGYDHRIAACGAMDIFRLRKFTYSLFQSQRDPRVVRPDVESGPMVFIASYWTPRESPTKVVVFSNCDEVELLLNGRPLARRAPDAGPTTRYNQRQGSDPTPSTVGATDLDTSGGDPFDGGNCEHLDHPPFTFCGVPWEDGELRAVGYLDGQGVAEHIVQTPGAPTSLELSFALSGRSLEANGADAIFVYASVVDAAGTLVPRAEHPITFEVDGPAQVIGPTLVIAEAGIAPALLRAGTEPGTITVTARSKGLQEVGGKIASVPESAIGQYEVLSQSRSTRDDLAAFRDLRTASKSLEG